LTIEEQKWLKNNPNIKLIASLGHEPALFKNSKGEVVGILADYYKEVSKLIGQDLEFEYFVSGEKNTIALINKDGIYGSSMLFDLPKYDKTLTLSNAYMQTPFIIFSTLDKYNKIKKIEDLVGKRVAVLDNNNAVVEYISKVKNVDLVYVKSIRKQLELLQYGKVDALIGYSNYHFLINKFLFDNIRPAFNSKESMGLVFGVHKEHELFISILNKAIEKINTAKKQKIISKWLNKNGKNSLGLTIEEQEYLIKKPVLTTINMQDYPPFNFNENGEARGYTVDYVNLMAKKLGVKVRFLTGRTWNEYLEMLKNNEIDFIPHVAITESRKEFLDFTNFRHITYEIGMALKKGSEINSILDLSERTIAIQKNNFIHEYLKNNYPKMKFVFVNDNQEALEAISSNKAYATIASIPALDYYIKKNWLTNIKTQKIKNLDLETVFHMPMGVSKGNDTLKSILEKANKSIPLKEENQIKQNWIDLKDSTIKKSILSKDERAYLKNKKSINMCIDPNWMPFEKNQNGKHIGMSADYIKILQAQIKTPIVHIPTKTWSESLEFGKSRKCDIFSLVMPNSERKKYWEFSKPYLSVPLIIATSIEKFFISDIKSVLDKKLGIVKGYAYIEILKEKYPNIKLVEVENINEGLQKVRDDEIFGFVGTLSTVGYAIQKNYIGELKIAGKFENTWNLGIGVRNDEPILTNIFNKAIDTISEKQHQVILNKWVSVNYQRGVDYTILYQVIIGFILIVVVILYKNLATNRLNKKLVDANNEINDQQRMVDKYVLILNTDLKGYITEVNEAYSRHTGYSKEDLIGKKHIVMRHPDMNKEFFDKLWSDISNDKIWKGEIKNFTKTNETCWLNTYIEPIFKDGKKIGYRSINEDITDKKRIEELSITDKLTGLYNRMKIDEILNTQMQEYKRYQNPFSIILLDIDDFKEINDNYGHAIGDYVLEEIAKRLTLNIRTTDIVGRWGGEEFIIICKNTKGSNALIVAEHLRELIQTIPFDEVGVKTISLGVTEFNNEDDINSVFKRADDALYKAKNSGKNRTILF